MMEFIWHIINDPHKFYKIEHQHLTPTQIESSIAKHDCKTKCSALTKINIFEKK